MSALDELLTIIETGDDLLDGTLPANAAAELAQLRADLQAVQERIAWLTTDIGESGLAAINRLIAACERGDIAQQAAPDLSIARDEILRQARQLDAARELEQHIRGLNDYEVEFIACPVCDYPPIICECGYVPIRAWLAANPAPPEGEGRSEAERQISDVELAAYRYYLGESGDRLCKLFESMPVDEGERYRNANAREPTP